MKIAIILRSASHLILVLALSLTSTLLLSACTQKEIVEVPAVTGDSGAANPPATDPNEGADDVIIIVGETADNDKDDDGILDDADNCLNARNPEQSDIDADGIGDECDRDKDDDGAANEKDNCPPIPNTDQANNDQDPYQSGYSNTGGDACDIDDDNDGVIDMMDNCPFTANPDAKDLDNDGMGDACDDDQDGDGVVDSADNCRVVANEDQADRDSDGIGDKCDQDYDNDGIADAEDNCPENQNADQANNDGDSYQLGNNKTGGDVCDTDDDNDDILDVDDNCRLVINKDQLDNDADSFAVPQIFTNIGGDACDVDDDNDGILDSSPDACPFHDAIYAGSLSLCDSVMDGYVSTIFNNPHANYAANKALAEGPEDPIYRFMRVATPLAVAVANFGSAKYYYLASTDSIHLLEIDPTGAVVSDSYKLMTTLKPYINESPIYAMRFVQVGDESYLFALIYKAASSYSLYVIPVSAEDPLNFSNARKLTDITGVTTGTYGAYSLGVHSEVDGFTLYIMKKTGTNFGVFTVKTNLIGNLVSTKDNLNLTYIPKAGDPVKNITDSAPTWVVGNSLYVRDVTYVLKYDLSDQGDLIGTSGTVLGSLSYRPISMSSDASGRLYINRANQWIYYYDESTKKLVSAVGDGNWGSRNCDNGSFNERFRCTTKGVTVRFDNTIGFDFDGNSMLVSEYDNKQLRGVKFDFTTGKPVVERSWVVAGEGFAHPSTDQSFYDLEWYILPYDLAIDKNQKFIFMVHDGVNRITVSRLGKHSISGMKSFETAVIGTLTTPVAVELFEGEAEYRAYITATTFGLTPDVPNSGIVLYKFDKQNANFISPRQAILGFADPKKILDDLRITPDGKFLYALDASVDIQVVALDQNNGGLKDPNIPVRVIALGSIVPSAIDVVERVVGDDHKYYLTVLDVKARAVYEAEIDKTTGNIKTPLADNKFLVPEMASKTYPRIRYSNGAYYLMGVSASKIYAFEYINGVSRKLVDPQYLYIRDGLGSDVGTGTKLGGMEFIDLGHNARGLIFIDTYNNAIRMIR